MHPKNAAGIANSVDTDQTAPLWVCDVCLDLSVWKLRIITVYLEEFHLDVEVNVDRMWHNTIIF